MEPYFITPILKYIDYDILDNYIKSKKDDKNLSYDVIDRLEVCRKKICASKTYQELNKFKTLNTNTTSDRWKMISIKKNNMTNIYNLFNKLTESTLDIIIKSFNEIVIETFDELVKIADIYAGKCILEIDNSDNNLLINFLIEINKLKSWYIEHDDYIYSFREVVLIVMQKEFMKLLDMAGQIEYKYKNNIENEILLTEYIKKKNILLGLIKYLAELYNNKLYSHQICVIVINKLYNEYMMTEQLIYFELFLNYFALINEHLKYNDDKLFDNKLSYITTISNNLNDMRIKFNVSSLLDRINHNSNDSDEILYDEIIYDDQFEYLLNEYSYNNDYNELISSLKNIDKCKLIDYIIIYIGSEISRVNNDKLYQLIKNILNDLYIDTNHFIDRYRHICSDEDIISELPLCSKIKIDKLI